MFKKKFVYFEDWTLRYGRWRITFDFVPEKDCFPYLILYVYIYTYMYIMLLFSFESIT